MVNLRGGAGGTPFYALVKASAGAALQRAFLLLGRGEGSWERCSCQISIKMGFETPKPRWGGR